VAIVRPEPGEAVFGPVRVLTEIYPLNAEVETVEFFLDGLRLASAESPPWEVLIDAGQDNVPHVLEVIAHSVSGEAATARLITPAVRVDIEVDVELRQLYVSPEAPDSLAGCERTDFQVFDSRVVQHLVTFEHGDVPFSAVLLLDASISMAGGKLQTALEAAHSFVRRLETLDEAKLILFSDRILHETPFTNFASILTLGLSKARAQGGSAINDVLYLAHKRLEPRQGRKVIFLLSDGVDIESILPMSRVGWISQQHEAAVYWIQLGSPQERDLETQRMSSWRDAEGHRREIELLAKTVNESGGRILPIDDASQIDGALQELLRELRSQYVLGYYPSVTAGHGAWHDVEVRARGTSKGLRTRRGYLEF
jgi:Ca-activated chloride channel family protein